MAKKIPAIKETYTKGSYRIEAWYHRTSEAFIEGHLFCNDRLLASTTQADTLRNVWLTMLDKPVLLDAEFQPPEI